ncbi:hypothetical protein AR457_01765 [Streptomyces agglomeratus]|uniref:hypothetical protein n=1 Tax=Streptomyces agglomeratus TaxID=285458 RepID=UPI0008543558|nr:hypothetical protein [Streptomyces agglomeratus]OEJ43012.1 hypothetical protein AR457_01765 [Streptomyces agglomeratus]
MNATATEQLRVVGVSRAGRDRIVDANPGTHRVPDLDAPAVHARYRIRIGVGVPAASGGC